MILQCITKQALSNGILQKYGCRQRQQVTQLCGPYHHLNKIFFFDQISSRAGTGIASEAWLIGRFSTVSVNILRAATLGDPLGRLADAVLDVLSDWVPPVYRLTGVSEGVGPRALVDRAQAWMAAGDFTRAVDQLGELTGLPAEVAAPWLAEARARIAADRTRVLLGKHMLTLAQPEGTPSK